MAFPSLMEHKWWPTGLVGDFAYHQAMAFALFIHNELVALSGRLTIAELHTATITVPPNSAIVTVTVVLGASVGVD